MKRIGLPTLILCLLSLNLLGQGFTRQTYHDREKKNLKEVYVVKDTIRNILHGRYISYFLNGNVESKGQFTNNETTGVWEFFYETGNLKMRGILRHNANYGLWEYFYESGQKSMDGYINGKNREGEWKSYYENGQVKDIGEYKNNKRSGLWKSYFEDGVLKGEIDYIDDHGTFTEFYHSGKVLSEGPRVGQRNVGHWRFFAEDGTIYSEGEYANGKKNGEWIDYHSTGKTASRGRYENDIPVGDWEYYFDNGQLSGTSAYSSAGQKSGYWKTYSPDGKVKSEITYEKGVGEYREYYASGKLKVKGKIIQDKKEGKWEYFYEDGVKEGECEYSNGKGTYFGYYKNGGLQTKGAIDGDTKTGTWEIYENDGNLSGYYRPFYDDKKLSDEITSLAENSSSGKGSSTRRKMTYFDARFNEFRGVILATNPVLTFTGKLPVSVEFYFQERLGHEFEFTGLRDPFFTADGNIPAGERYRRGYSIAMKQKFYNQVKSDLWYFGHELRFTNHAHFINEPIAPGAMDVYTFGASEQRVEYGPILGYRLMKKNNGEGFTIDVFISANLGFRVFDVDANHQSYFENVNQSTVSTGFNFGFNFGRVFSFR
ncbi:MAG TPA: toxin-antitoxin system YwqK family antitoxin [Chryseosolibacter sp.]|nr:toxin-antitoxin system YwqK family antitoxin [Chryseosolibacter sp.]